MTRCVQTSKKIRAIVEYLARNPSAALILEGNADERGTNEINFVIAQRYADSVKKYLLMQGVADSQMDAVSAGEEKPADLGHTEKAWARLRDLANQLLTLVPSAEDALFQEMYIPICNFAVFQHNRLNRKVLAYDMYSWLHRHAKNDLQAAELLSGNMNAAMEIFQ